MNSFIETLNLAGGQFLDFAWPMLWQSSLLIAIVFALDFLLARKIRAAVRYALWLAVLLKLLLPPALALPTSAAWWLFPAKPEAKTPAINNFTVTYDDAPPRMNFAPQAFAIPKPSTPSPTFAGWALLASSLIDAGLVLFLAFRWWQLSQGVRRATISNHFSEPLNAARQLAGLRSTARLKISDDRMSPAVCGLFRPVILLPRTLAEKLSPAQLRAVLLHELIHLRRKDVWVNCAQALLQIFYWWHPLLWLANARIRRLREEAVDDAVMLALRDEADAYPPTLLEVAKLAIRRPLMSLGLVGIMESRSALRQRIERLVDFRAPRKAGLTFASVCGIFVFSAVALPMGEAPGPAEKQIVPASAPAISPPPVLAQTTNAPSVLVSAQFYQMAADDFKKLVANLEFKPGALNENSWWSASPWLFQTLKGELKISGLNPIMSPRVQTFSGAPAQMYVGNGTNGIEFDCTPVVNGESVNLAVHGRMVDQNENSLSTNQFRASTSAENAGGIVIAVENRADSTVSNLVAVIGVQVVTKSPAGHLQPRLAPLGETIPMDSQSQEKALVQDGKLFYEMGKLDEAKEKFQSALALNSENTSAKYYLGLIQAGARNTNAIYTGPGRQEILRKLETIRLENFSTSDRGLPLNEVLKQFSQQSKLLDPERKGINFLINNNPAFSGQPVAGPTAKTAATTNESVDVGSFLIKIPGLTNACFADLLDAVVLAADHPIKYSIQDYAIAFSAKGPETPQLFIRTFRLDTNAFQRFLGKIGEDNAGQQTQSPADPLWADPLQIPTQASAPAPSKLATALFANFGISLQDPPGKTVFYKERLGYLFVKATQSDLDTIERALQAFGTQPAPPQIHIKARFLEMPAGTVADFGQFLSATNSAASHITGILNDTNTRTFLRVLEARKGIKVLAEPEVTTLSGRQTQMRATQLVAVVTNVAWQTTPTNGFVPQTSTVETGPILDVVPYVLADGYTINLAVIPSVKEFLGYDAPPGKHFFSSDIQSNLPAVLPKFSVRQVVATLNLWDNQTAIISGLAEKKYVLGQASTEDSTTGEKELLVIITATIVDSAGNRVHSDDEMPFAKKGTPPPPQPTRTK